MTIAYTKLKGTLSRVNGTKVVTLENGNKSKELKTTTRWRHQEYYETTDLQSLVNTTNQAIAILVGKCNPPLVAIDADSAHTRDILLQVLKTLPAHAQPLLLATSNKVQHGKDGAHLIYIDNGDNNELYSALGIKDNSKKLGVDLDIIRGDNLLFLAGEANSLKAKPQLNINSTSSIPDIIQIVLKGLTPQIQLNTVTTPSQYEYETQYNDNQLAILFEDYLSNTKKRPELLNSFLQLRTAKDQRSLFTNPDQLTPQTYTGKPHTLLLGLSLSLRNDIGITKDLHRAIIAHINTLLPHSKDLTALHLELLTPDTKEPYPYKEDWKQMTASLKNKRNHILNIYAVSVSSETKVKGIKYLIHNSHNNEITAFKDLTALKNELVSDTGIPASRISKIQPRIDTIALIERPNKPFGLLPKQNSRPDFNIYQRTMIQEVFYNPTHHQENRKYPTTIIALLEAQFGQDKVHKLLLPFLKHKLITREPTALIFALMGPPYSFKTGFFEGILRPLFSAQRYLKTNGDILTEKYNEFLIDLDILAIDEFHHLQGTPLLKPVVQELNKFGSEFHEGIRRMYSSVSKGEEIPQEVTPFIAMNRVVPPVTEIVGERRLVVGYADRTASQALDISDEKIKQRVKAEIVDFAYYLATEPPQITYEDYNLNTAWKKVDNHYYRFMNEGISIVKRLALAIGSTRDIPDLTKLKELISPAKLETCIFELQRSNRGSKYRLRLWASKAGDIRSDVPALLDSFESNYSDIGRDLQKLLTNNERVYMYTSRYRALDLILYPDDLALHNIVLSTEDEIPGEELKL